jgi:LmbE family N-acetylglucosaminyl deacetylase
MIPFKINHIDPLNILLLGAHCDDIEIGCGSTLLKILDLYPVNQVKWVIFTSNETRKKEAEKSASLFLEGVKNKEILIKDYRDGFLPAIMTEVKDYFETLKKSFNPDIIFTHYRDDMHQDHRLVNQLTWNTFRNHTILEYEIPKYDGDLGTPNFFVNVENKYVDRKIEILLNSFESQASKHWFDRETFTALMRIRAMESANAGKYTEAFYARKISF